MIKLLNILTNHSQPNLLTFNCKFVCQKPKYIKLKLYISKYCVHDLFKVYYLLQDYKNDPQ